MGLSTNYKLEVDGKDKTQLFKPMLTSLSVTDNSSETADTLEIELNDNASLGKMPKNGEKIKLWLQGIEGKMEFIGEFMVDEIGLSGPPNRMSIRARSVDFRESLKTMRSETWQNQGPNTQIQLSDVLNKIASRNRLQARISDIYKNTGFASLSQTKESDLNLLNRLAKKYNAILKIAQGKMMFVSKDTQKSVSGQTLAKTKLSRSDIQSWSMSLFDRDKYSAVVAKYLDIDSASIKEETIEGKADGGKLVLKEVFASQDEARHAAMSKLQETDELHAEVSLALLNGRPEIIAEGPLALEDLRPDISTEWIIKRVTHSISSDAALQTKLTAVQKV